MQTKLLATHLIISRSTSQANSEMLGQESPLAKENPTMLTTTELWRVTRRHTLPSVSQHHMTLRTKPDSSKAIPTRRSVAILIANIHLISTREAWSHRIMGTTMISLRTWTSRSRTSMPARRNSSLGKGLTSTAEITQAYLRSPMTCQETETISAPINHQANQTGSNLTIGS